MNDRVGNKYGRLLVIRRDHGKYYECLCDCGNTKIVSADHLGKDTNSCGCLKREIMREKKTTHGEAKTRLHKLWCTIRERCNSENGSESNVYYARGIRMCDEWNDYTAFRDWAMANGYDPNAKRGTTTIDRIDNEKGYCPENCRFVTLTENARNKRDTRRFNFLGETLTVGEIAERAKTSVQLIGERLRRGWGIEDAALKPKRVFATKGE